MATPKLQTTRALEVIKSDNCNIPYPALIVSSSNTGNAASQVVDAAVNFITLGVMQGDIIYNITDGAAATITGVTNATTLKLNANIFAANAKAYKIYSKESESNGCVLYIGGDGNLAITTADNDDVTLIGLIAGTFVPVQVIKIKAATTCTNIVALW